MLKSIFRCHASQNPEDFQLKRSSNIHQGVIQFKDFPRHDISCMDDFMHRLQLMSKMDLNNESYLCFRNQLVKFRTEFIKNQTGEISAVGAATQMFEKVKFSAEDFMTFKKLREFAQKFGSNPHPTNQGPLFSDFQAMGPIVSSSLFRRAYASEKKNIDFESLGMELKEGKNTKINKAHLDFCSQLMDFYEGAARPNSMMASTLNKLNKLDLMESRRLPVAPPPSQFWDSVARSPLDPSSRKLIHWDGTLSQAASRLDHEIQRLINKHLVVEMPEINPVEINKHRNEYKDKLLSQLWFCSHFEKNPELEWPVPPCKSKLIDPIRFTKTMMLNPTEGSLGIENSQAFKKGIQKLCDSPDFERSILELLSGPADNPFSFARKGVFENLPKAAKQVIVDSMNFENSLRGHQHLSGLNLQGFNFSKVELRNSNLKDCALTGIFTNDMSGACLDGADLSNFSMIGDAKIDHASLKGAKFDQNVLNIGQRFHSCDLTQVQIDFSHIDSSHELSDFHLNHLYNGNSLLSRLRDWPDGTPIASATRASLMQKLAASLNRDRPRDSYSPLNDLPIVRAIADVVLRDPQFSTDPHPEMKRLRQTVVGKLLSDRDPWASRVFSTGRQLDSKEIIQACLKSAIDIMSAARPASSLNGIMRIEAMLTRSKHPESQKLAASMSDACMNSLLDAGLRHDAQDLVSLCAKLREAQWTRLSPELKDLLSAQGIDATAHDFFVEQNVSRTHCVAFDDSYMKSLNNIMADKTVEPGFDWKNVYLFVKNEQDRWEGPNAVGRSSVSQDPVLHDLQSFSLETCYRRQAASLLKEKANQLFDLAASSGASGMNEFSMMFSHLRQQASQTQQAERLNWLSAEKSNQLAEILGSCMLAKDPQSADAHPMSPGSMRLTPEHTGALNHVLNEFCDADPQTRARWFFALGTTYTQLSSSTFMGTEVDSPLPVRTYAAALLSHAKELDPEIFRNQQGIDQFHEWHAQLCGEGQAFTCTALLSHRLMSQCQEHPQDDVMKTAFATVYPTSWS